MKNVELIRQRVVRAQVTEIQRLRTFISMADSMNHEAIAALQGENAQLLVEQLVEIIMARLGHATIVVGKEAHASSKAARAVAKLLKVPKGE